MGKGVVRAMIDDAVNAIEFFQEIGKGRLRGR